MAFLSKIQNTQDTTIDNIEAVADGRETINFRNEMTAEEIVKLKDAYFEENLKIKNLQQEIKELNSQKREMLKQAAEYQDTFTSGGKDVQIEKAFFIDNHSRNVREYYHPVSHEKVYERKLKISENQLRISQSM